MGTYKSIRIMADTKSPEVVKESFIFLFPNKKQFNLGLQAKEERQKQFLAAQRKAKAAQRKKEAEELEKQEREQLRLLKLKYG